MADTWLPLLGATLFFTLLHALALSSVEPVFPRAFKLSRGAAAAILTAIGVAALLSSLDQWQNAFLYRHEEGDWMRIGLLAVLGHLIADFLWMAVGKWRYGVQPRADLVIHHGLGVIAFSAALYLRIGYAIALITMITEILPVTTGINAWGKRIAAPALVDAADRARLHVLAWLRLPLWGALFVLVVMALVQGATGGVQIAYWLACAGLVGLVTLDLYWMQKCRQRVDFY